MRWRKIRKEAENTGKMLLKARLIYANIRVYRLRKKSSIFRGFVWSNRKKSGSNCCTLSPRT